MDVEKGGGEEEWRRKRFGSEVAALLVLIRAHMIVRDHLF